MTLLFMDGFDVGDFALKWTNYESSPVSSATTRFNTGKSVSLGYSRGLRYSFAPSATTIIGFAYMISALEDHPSIIRFYGDTGATNHLYISNMSSGALQLRKGDGTVLGTSTAGIIRNGAWNYVEMSFTIADSGGRAILKVNGVTQIDFTGDTKNGGTNTTLDTVYFINDNIGTLHYYDDLYICDGLGSSPNNDFLGDVRVQTLLPTGAGASTQWTPSVGNNWDNVNDAPYVSTTYNSANEAGLRDTYAMGDVNGATMTIFGVQANLLALKTDSGSANLKHVVRSGGTDYYGADRVLGTSLGSYVAVREVDPATSAAWDNAGINAVEFGVEVV